MPYILLSLIIAVTVMLRMNYANLCWQNGFTPLHLASQEGHTDVVTLLLDRRANSNSRAKNGLTPMHLAAQEDHVPVAEILVKYKAQIDPQTKVWSTLRYFSALSKSVSLDVYIQRQSHENTGQSRTGASSVPAWKYCLTGPVTVVPVADGLTCSRVSK